MKVADIKGAYKPVVTVSSTFRLRDVANVMRSENVGALVVSAGPQAIAGIITERDIVDFLATAGSRALDLTAADVMSRQVPTCSAENRVNEVMQTMLRQRIRHLPLVEHGRLVGMVSMGDVVKALVDQMELEISVVHDMYLAARSH
jgi:CBS domain-containing protein